LDLFREMLTRVNGQKKQRSWSIWGTGRVFRILEGKGGELAPLRQAEDLWFPARKGPVVNALGRKIP